MVVKGNQKTLQSKIERFFKSPALFEPRFSTATTQDIGRGRIERRQIVCSSDIPSGYLSFPGVAQLFFLTRTVIRKGTGELLGQESVYGMTSLSGKEASPRRLLSLIRGHWHIENKSHHVRDVTFDEDRSQVRCGSIPQVMAAIRNVCIGLLRLHGHNNIAAACRFHAANPKTALALVGLPKTE